jgi:hypothetical protein
MRTFYEVSAAKEDTGGSIAAAATARSMSALAPFTVAHVAGRPAAVLVY